MTHPIDLSVIIVNWNARALLAECLTSLAGGGGSLTFETLVIDNASTDGSQDMVRADFPWVRHHVNAINLGFAAANNQAISRAAGRYLLLLNPDTQVPPGTLEALVRYADAHSDIGCLGPRLLTTAGLPQRSCWRGFPGLTMALSDALYIWKAPTLPIARQIEFNPAELTAPVDVDHLLGACLLIRREAWKQVGELDEGFFLFLEETDWCYRARAKGWRIVFHPGIDVIHAGAHSVHQVPQCNLPQFYSSYCRFYRKRRPDRPLGVLLLKGIIAMAALLRIGLWTARASQSDEVARRHARAMRAGYRQVLKALPAF
jgi:N-acetylglucosaminyl-diphospho-decaprenol L-rhamnosyltransferase